MSKKQHWTNPPNPHLDAYLDAWRAYTAAYHNDAPKEIQSALSKAYEAARMEYEANPQSIFHSGQT